MEAAIVSCAVALFLLLSVQLYLLVEVQRANRALRRLAEATERQAAAVETSLSLRRRKNLQQGVDE